MSALGVSQALRGKRHGKGFLVRCPLPSHGQGHGDRHPSLSVRDGADVKLLVFCHSGCASADVLAALRDRGLDGGDHGHGGRSRQPILPSHAAAPSDPDPDARALALWNSAVPAPRTLAEAYVRYRGIRSPIPPSIRFLPDADPDPSRLVETPAMVAAVQRPDGKIIAVQVTFLDPSGRGRDKSSDRRTIGKLGSGAVRVGAAGDVLGLSEGVETGLAAQQIYDLPVWCSLGASRLCGLTLPAEVKKVVFADRDQAGADAATRHAGLGRAARLRAGAGIRRGAAGVAAASFTGRSEWKHACLTSWSVRSARARCSIGGRRSTPFRSSSATPTASRSPSATAFR